MVFNQIVQEYYESKIKKAEVDLKKIVLFLVKGLLLTIACFSFAVIGISNAKQGTLISIFAGIAVFPGMASLIVTILGVSQFFMASNEIKKEKSLIKNPPILEIYEDGSLSYQRIKGDYKEQLDQINGYKIIEKTSMSKYIVHQLIVIRGVYRNEPKTIEIISEFTEKQKLLEVLNVYKKIADAQKMFINTLKDALYVYKDNVELMLRDIETMEFIMQVNYLHSGSLQGNYQLYLKYGTALEVELFEDEDGKNYACIYTSMEEIQNNKKQQILIMYNDLLNKINENACNIFVKNQIDGILINKNSNCIKIAIMK